MIKAKSIKITRDEGPARLCISRVFEGERCWESAHEWLRSMRHTYPERGYDKHDFEITFEDGSQYYGRLDCQADGADTDVAAHVRKFLEFASGRRKPSHMTDKTYKAILARNPYGTKWAAEAMDKCEIPVLYRRQALVRPGPEQ